MKTYIYISGFVAGFLFMGWLLAFALGMSNHLLMLVSGSVVVVFIYLPLVIRKRKIHRQRMKGIIQKYQEERETGSDKKLQTEPGRDATEGISKHGRKGWSMNNSPFRERKSGVTWGGGNIHAANASRGSRKSRK